MAGFVFDLKNDVTGCVKCCTCIGKNDEIPLGHGLCRQKYVSERDQGLDFKIQMRQAFQEIPAHNGCRYIHMISNDEGRKGTTQNRVMLLRTSSSGTVAKVLA
jgi:hypothetical protein